MASATSDDFLSGQGVPVDLHGVETELERLWRPAADQAGGDGEPGHANVTRIVLSNLVLVGRSTEAARLDGVLDTVTTRYPSRAIVVSRNDDPGRTISAEISALCHLPAPGLPQVCSERIVLRAGPEAASLLPGAVRPLLESELPFVLWWTSNPSNDESVFRALGHECSRLILDLPDPGADPAAIRMGLDPAICRFSRDSAWFGLTRWRELIATFFDPPIHNETLGRIDSVTIDAVSPDSRTPPRLAIWLAAWLAGQLVWTPEGQPTRDGGRLTARFHGPTGDVAVEIRTTEDATLSVAQLSATALTTREIGDAGAELFRLRRIKPTSPEVRVDIDSNAYCTLPRSVLAPEFDAARRISAALESSRVDPPFEKALPHALWLMGA